MKVLMFLLILIVSASAQVFTYDTEWLFKRGNEWEDSVSIRNTSGLSLTQGLPTYQVSGDTLQDTLISNPFNIEEKDIGNNWIALASWNDSTATGAPDTINSVLEIGLFMGSGGYPDSTGVLWQALVTITQDTTMRIQFSDSTWYQLFAPPKIWFRFRETTAQKNKYSLTLNTKRGK